MDLGMAEILPAGQQLYRYGVKNPGLHWIRIFFTNPVDALAYAIFKDRTLASGSNPSYLLTIVLYKNTQVGVPLPVDADGSVKDVTRLGNSIPIQFPVTGYVDSTIPGLKAYFLVDVVFPYVSYPDSVTKMNVPGHTVDSDYYTYKILVKNNARAWFPVASINMYKLSFPNELLAYTTFIDSVFNQGPLEESIYGKQNPKDKSAYFYSIVSRLGQKVGFSKLSDLKINYPAIPKDAPLRDYYRYPVRVLNGKEVIVNTTPRANGGLRDAIMSFYINQVLPGHTYRLINFSANSDDPQSEISTIWEYIPELEHLKLNELSTRLFVACRRRMLEMTKAELCAGIYYGVQPGHGFMAKYPLDELNPVLYRIGYKYAKFLTAKFPKIYNAELPRSGLYNQLNDAYEYTLQDVEAKLHSNLSTEDRMVVIAFRDELEEQKSFFG